MEDCPDLFIDCKFSNFAADRFCVKLMLFINILFSAVELVAAGLMFAKHKQQPDRSRLFIAFFFLLSAASVLVITIDRVAGLGLLGSDTVMSPVYIILGFIIYFLLLLYPIEVMRPRWMTLRRALRLLLPWLFFLACLAIVAPFGFRDLLSAREILPNINETDVYLRIVLSLIFIPYGLWSCRIQYNWQRSSASKKWVRIIVALAMLMTVTFSFHSLFNIRWMIYVHAVLYILLTCLILRLELVSRFRVPDNASQKPARKSLAGDGNAVSARAGGSSLPDAYAGDAEPDAYAGDSEPDASAGDSGTAPVSLREESSGHIREKLTVLMNTPGVWQNPELSMGELCNLVGTNTTYLQQAIKEMGWQSYSDMINRKRIEYVCHELTTGREENIQDVFYRAGYRSRVTAWRNFTAITGLSPAEWISREQSSES